MGARKLMRATPSSDPGGRKIKAALRGGARTMQGGEFLAAGAAVIADWRLRIAGSPPPNPQSTIRNPQLAQEPTLAPEVFARRIERAQTELNSRKLDCLIATPGTNYEYFTGYNPGRSERLIAVVIPATGKTVVVCPAFEVERIKQHGAIADARGWEEQANPYKLLKSVVRELRPRGNGVIALESTTSYDVYLALADQLSGWKFVNGAPVTERLRIIKAPEEIVLIRRAIDITEAAIAATFAELAAGQSERDVAQLLSREMQQRGAPGGGLVQFGPSSALPHGGPAGPRLERETVVLIDCGCRVTGYESDITRTSWFGDHPSDEATKVFNLVHDAQSAAGRPRTPGRSSGGPASSRTCRSDGGRSRCPPPPPPSSAAPTAHPPTPRPAPVPRPWT